MNQPKKRTQAELNELINNWRSDPAWVLWETEGYDDHADELKAYEEAYWEDAYKRTLQVETLFQDLTGGTEDEDADLAEMLESGWEILNLTVTTLGTDKHDGLWRAEHHRVITLMRVARIATDREERLDEALVALMSSASDEDDRLALEELALAMLYAELTSDCGESERSE